MIQLTTTVSGTWPSGQTETSHLYYNSGDTNQLTHVMLVLYGIMHLRVSTYSTSRGILTKLTAVIVITVYLSVCLHISDGGNWML